jgi:AraC family transcriptional regulator
MRETTIRGHQQRLGKVIAYIEKHINDPLTLEQLSEIACLSPFHFHRVFSAEMGESLYEHIKRLRLEHAAFRLKYSDKSIDKISYNAGYERNTSFTKAFKQHFGQSPRNYRVAHHQRGEKSKITLTPRIMVIDDFDVAYVREKGNYYHAAKNAWQSLLTNACRSGLIGGQTKAYGITYDSPEITAESQIRYDACISLSDCKGSADDFLKQTIQGGRYAVFHHRGPYENLEPVYSTVYGQWLPDSGYQLRNLPSYCHYHHIDASNVPDEYLMTDIYLPIQ